MLVESYDSGGIGFDGSFRWMTINKLMFLKFERDQMYKIWLYRLIINRVWCRSKQLPSALLRDIVGLQTPCLQRVNLKDKDQGAVLELHIICSAYWFGTLGHASTPPKYKRPGSVFL